jgi:TonB family protein
MASDLKIDEIYLNLQSNIRKMKKLGLRVTIALFFLGLIQNTAFTQNFTPAHTYSDSKLLQDFLCSEVIYPKQALQQGIEGKVIISFIVEKDGGVSQVKVKSSASPELDAEAMRLFKLLLWEPATSFGQPVASENEFPIDFNIKKYNKHCKSRGYIIQDYPYKPVDSSNIVYDYKDVDKKPFPVFEDKEMNLATFISKNIKYPETAYKQSLSGKVTLQYVVELHGNVSNIKVLAPVGGGCTQEAIRLLEMIHWMPGIENGKAVRTIMKMDIDFKLPDDTDTKMFENSPMNSN